MKKLILVLSLFSTPLYPDLFFYNDPVVFFDQVGKKIIEHYLQLGQMANIHKLFPEAFLREAGNEDRQMLASLEKFAIEYIKQNPEVLKNMDKFEEGLPEHETVLFPEYKDRLKYLINKLKDAYLNYAQEKKIAVDTQAIEAIAALNASTRLMADGYPGTFFKNVIAYALQQINN